MSNRSEFEGLWAIYLGVAAALVALVFLLVGFAVLRFRRARNPHPSRRRSLDRTELASAVALAALAAVLVAFTFATERRVDRVGATSAAEIRVTAFQWGWRFDYGGGAVVVGTDRDAPTLTVPEGAPVRFTLLSRDVIHAFWIPHERFKRDAFPKRETRFDLTFDSAGTYRGTCAEFCGLRHADMTFDVRVLPRAEFDSWLRTQRG